MYHIHELIQISQNLPLVEKPLSDYEHMLEKDFWEATDQASLHDMLFQTTRNAQPVFLTPMSVLKNPDLAPAHHKRIQEADMQYPILVDETNDVLDGLHRLAKAYKDKQKMIRAKILPRHILDALKMRG